MSERRGIAVHHEDPADQLCWQIGDVEVTRVEESVVEMSPRYLLPDVSQDLLDATGDWQHPFFTEDGRMMLSMHSFVVRSRDNTIVVDTCVGAHTERPLPGDAGFAERLEAAIPGGFAAVTHVVCTHLHFDHVGWNTREVDGAFVPTFPNARYLVSGAELAATREDDDMNVLDSSITPLLDAGLLDEVEQDHCIDDRVALVPSSGHTPGHVCVGIDSAGSQALITGDSFHSPIQFAHPEISATHADFDSAAAGATRRRLIAELVDQPTMVLGTHFAPPTAGRVRSGSDRAWFETEI